MVATNQALLLFTILNEDKGWHSLNVISMVNAVNLVDVYLNKGCFATIRGRKLFKQSDSFMATPGCIKSTITGTRVK